MSRGSYYICVNYHGPVPRVCGVQAVDVDVLMLGGFHVLTRTRDLMLRARVTAAGGAALVLFWKSSYVAHLSRPKHIAATRGHSQTV